MTLSIPRLQSIAGARVQLHSEREHSGLKKDNKKTTKPDVQLNLARLTQELCFTTYVVINVKSIAPHLVCDLHTICSDVTQKKSSLHLRLSFTQTR